MGIHFEKKPESKLRKRDLFFGAIFLALLIAGLGVLFLRTSSDDFWQIKFIDLFSLVAQVATAGALILGVYQYQRNKQLDRQIALVAECRSLIEKMTIVANNFAHLAGPTPSQAKELIRSLVSANEKFDAIYLSLSEDINKAIVRMHWQDFYFESLTAAISNIDGEGLVEAFGMPTTAVLGSLLSIRSKKTVPESLVSFEAYSMAVEKNFQRITIKAQDAVDLFMFERYFFTHQSLNDHLYGTMNIVDPKIRIPAIHALNIHVNKSFYS